MNPVSLLPTSHLFVCSHKRSADAPLGPGCGEAGRAVLEALREGVAARGRTRDVWVTETACLGICPKQGATIACYPHRAIYAEVHPTDVAELLDRAVTERAASDALEGMLQTMADLQRDKVLELARRIKPGLTLEDVRNPHDFPELDDPDWHFEDGILVGLESVLTALRALRRDRASEVGP